MGWRNGIHFPRYAVDIQLYVPIKADDESQITQLETCLYAAKKWMSGNFLLLILDTTIGHSAQQRQYIDHVTVTLDNCVIS